MTVDVCVAVVKPVATMGNAREKPSKASTIGKPKRPFNEGLLDAIREIVI